MRSDKILSIFLKDEPVRFVDVLKKTINQQNQGLGANQLKIWDCRHRGKGADFRMGKGGILSVQFELVPFMIPI